MSFSRICAARLAAIVVAGIIAGPSLAQSSDGSAPALRGTGSAAKSAAKPVKKAASRKTKTAMDKAGLDKTDSNKTPQKPELAPWAAIDPARAGEKEQPLPNAAPMPGVHHDVATAEGNTTLGVKWNSNNDPNYGPMTTTGLVNSYSNATTGTPDPGTSIQPGVKFKF